MDDEQPRPVMAWRTSVVGSAALLVACGQTTSPYAPDTEEPQGGTSSGGTNPAPDRASLAMARAPAPARVAVALAACASSLPTPPWRAARKQSRIRLERCPSRTPPSRVKIQCFSRAEAASSCARTAAYDARNLPIASPPCRVASPQPAAFTKSANTTLTAPRSPTAIAPWAPASTAA